MSKVIYINNMTALRNMIEYDIEPDIMSGEVYKISYFYGDSSKLLQLKGSILLMSYPKSDKDHLGTELHANNK